MTGSVPTPVANRRYSTARITWLALINASARVPICRSSASALSLVTVAVSVLPGVSSSVTSLAIAPSSRAITVPASVLRAEVRSPSSPRARMTKLDLISASAVAPGTRPRSSTLPRVIVATISIPSMIGAEAALSFLAVGVTPPTPSWGRSIGDAIGWVQTDPMYLVFPGLALFLITLAFNVLGDALRDALDPRGGSR